VNSVVVRDGVTGLHLTRVRLFDGNGVCHLRGDSPMQVQWGILRQCTKVHAVGYRPKLFSPDIGQSRDLELVPEEIVPILVRLDGSSGLAVSERIRVEVRHQLQEEFDLLRFASLGTCWVHLPANCEVEIRAETAEYASATERIRIGPAHEDSVTLCLRPRK
jgi:hypothetical protein